MKTLKNFKQYICLFALTALLISFSELKAEVITDFSPSNFVAIDYYAYGHYIPRMDNEPNRYQLTDTFNGLKVAMWHNEMLDLSKDFVLNFKLFFGKGKESINGNYPSGDSRNKIADGICFVMQTAGRSFIGDDAWYIGYGHNIPPIPIKSSFAIEFDTEFQHQNINDDSFNEGGDTIGCHISYLQNGNMAALPDTYQPMQNDWKSVARNDWYCVVIWWRIGQNPNGTKYYDLLTYMEEKSNGQLFLRDSMRFNSLSELIGIPANSSRVIWGITAGTCAIPNKQAIEFMELVNREEIEKTITIGGEGFESEVFDVSDTFQIVCGAIIKPYVFSDTIRNAKMICNPNEVSITVEGLDYTDCKWYVLGSDDEYTELEDYEGKSSLPTSKLEDYMNEDNNAIVKVVLADNTEIMFKIRFKGNNSELLDYFTENGLNNGIGNIKDGGGTMIVTEDNLEQSIQLPELAEGCSYSVSIGHSSNSVYFTTMPEIVNGKLEFGLVEGNCVPASVTITKDCGDGCPEIFTITLNGFNPTINISNSCSGTKIAKVDLCNNEEGDIVVAIIYNFI